MSELADLGAARLIRVGTCGALRAELALGELVVVTEALSFDGTSRSLAPDDSLLPDPELLAGLRSAAGERAHEGPIASADLFYDTPPEDGRRMRDAGAVAVEMETATLFALAAAAGGCERPPSSWSPTWSCLRESGSRTRPCAQGERTLGEVALGALLR